MDRGTHSTTDSVRGMFSVNEGDGWAAGLHSPFTKIAPERPHADP